MVHIHRISPAKVVSGNEQLLLGPTPSIREYLDLKLPPEVRPEAPDTDIRCRQHFRSSLTPLATPNSYDTQLESALQAMISRGRNDAEESVSPVPSCSRM